MAVTLREVLEQGTQFAGWLCLPARPWSLDTRGQFVEADMDGDPSDPFPPEIVELKNLTDVLDAASIEDIIENARLQIPDPAIDKLFEAFLFYVENDAFIQFD